MTMLKEWSCQFASRRLVGDESLITCQVTEHRCPFEGSNPDCEVALAEIDLMDEADQFRAIAEAEAEDYKQWLQEEHREDER